MKEPNIKQFKLTNGEDLICEVLENETPENSAILMRGALKVLETNDFQRGVRFYGFKPWMTFSEDPSILQILNSNHVMGETKPEPKLIGLYYKTISDLKKFVAKKSPVNVNFEELQDAVENLTDEEFEDFLDHHEGDLEDELFLKDSDSTNVIKFKPRNTVH